MGIKRIVDTAFWADSKVDEFSPEDKYFMLYLLTNPFSTQLGIYEISIKQVAFQMGYSTDAVKVLIDRFESKYKMVYFSPETNEIAIKNFLRHSIIKGGAPVRDCLIKEIKNVKNKELIARVFLHIKDSESLNETVKKLIAEYEAKNGELLYTNKKDFTTDNENENENENDVSYHDTLTNRSKGKKSRKTKADEFRHQYGEYKNVLLSDTDLAKLKSEFPDWENRIERLSSYMKSKGKTYADHLATIRNWARREAQQKQEEGAAHGETTGNLEKVRYGNYV